MEQRQLHVYTCTDFKGRWPVGTAAIMVAYDAQDAADRLNIELKRLDLPGTVQWQDVKRIDLFGPSVHILLDGEY